MFEHDPATVRVTTLPPKGDSPLPEDLWPLSLQPIVTCASGMLRCTEE